MTNEEIATQITIAVLQNGGSAAAIAVGKPDSSVPKNYTPTDIGAFAGKLYAAVLTEVRGVAQKPVAVRLG